MSRAAVIGAGTMGNGIAHVFAQHGRCEGAEAFAIFDFEIEHLLHGR